ncbi:ankyrin repeat domain-containing protein [Krasilnikovia sp. MM14-A1259]|uniref:ankyrin repeat domain-containing protein n=1 Tax=Krasilnikovia sp. MM14-A1259 TaxID=3373539 RepID=UPI0037FBF693
MSWSPAHHAVEHEDLPRLRDLLDAGAGADGDGDGDGDGWTLLRHAIDVEHDGHVQTGEPLHADVTAFLLARGADPLRRYNGMPVVEEAAICGHWLAVEIMNAWINRRPDANGHDYRIRPAAD